MLSKGPGHQAIICTEQTNSSAVEVFQYFRKSLFVDALGWTLTTDSNREVDEFDTRRAVYCLLFENSKLVGGFRAIQGCYPYLAQTVFPQMASLRPFPARSDVWEISRFGVDPITGTADHAKRLYGVMLDFGRRRNATALVAIVDLSHERFLRQLGITTRRYGPPGVVGVDNQKRSLTAVAGEIPLTDQSGQGFQNLLAMVQNVEITDETLVFGHWSISA